MGRRETLPVNQPIADRGKAERLGAEALVEIFNDKKEGEDVVCELIIEYSQKKGIKEALRILRSFIRKEKKKNPYFPDTVFSQKIQALLQEWEASELPEHKEEPAELRERKVEVKEVEEYSVELQHLLNVDASKQAQNYPHAHSFLQKLARLNSFSESTTHTGEPKLSGARFVLKILEHTKKIMPVLSYANPSVRLFFDKETALYLDRYKKEDPQLFVIEYPSFARNQHEIHETSDMIADAVLAILSSYFRFGSLFRKKHRLKVYLNSLRDRGEPSQTIILGLELVLAKIQPEEKLLDRPQETKENEHSREYLLKKIALIRSEIDRFKRLKN